MPGVRMRCNAADAAGSHSLSQFSIDVATFTNPVESVWSLRRDLQAGLAVERMRG